MNTDGHEPELMGQGSRRESFGSGGLDQVLISTPEFNQRLDLIRHLTASSDRIPLIRGVEGMGKSTLLTRFQEMAPDDWDLCRIDATPVLQPDLFLQLLVRRYCPHAERGSGFDELTRRFDDLRQNGRLAVILVDDADLLPVATLIDLFNLYVQVTQQDGRLGIVLAASPQIDSQLMSQQLGVISPQVLQILELLPMSLEQTGQMIQQIIATRGEGWSVELSRSQLEKLFDTSGGIPGQVRQQIEPLIETSAPGFSSTGKSTLTSLIADIPGPAIVGGLVLLVLMGLTLVYQDEINALFNQEDPENQLPESQKIAGEKVVPLVLPSKPSMSEEIGDEAAPQASEDARQQLTVREAGAEVPARQAPHPTTNLSEQPIVREKENLPKSVTEAMSTRQVSKSGDLPPPEKVVAQSETEQVQLQQTVDEAPEPPTPGALSDAPIFAGGGANERSESLAKPQATQPARKIPAAPEPAKTVSAKSQPAKPATAATKPVKSEKAQPAQVTPEASSEPASSSPSPAPVREKGIKREAWLVKQNPKFYTLQLIGVRDEKGVDVFVERHKLQGKVAYFSTLRNAQPWYSVVYGLYPDRASANAARTGLPKKLADRGVWPRTMESIQKAIRGQ